MHYIFIQRVEHESTKLYQVRFYDSQEKDTRISLITLRESTSTKSSLSLSSSSPEYDTGSCRKFSEASTSHRYLQTIRNVNWTIRKRIQSARIRWYKCGRASENPEFNDFHALPNHNSKTLPQFSPEEVTISTLAILINMKLGFNVDRPPN